MDETISEVIRRYSVPDVLYQLNIFEFSRYFPDEKTAIDACYHLGLVPILDNESAPPCPKCHGSMYMKAGKGNRFDLRYKCEKSKKQIIKIRRSGFRPKRKALCNGSIAGTVNTFFHRVTLPATQVFKLMLAWIAELPIRVTYRHAGVSNLTAIEFYRRFREIAEITVSNMSLKIGGPGLHIELGESFKRKRITNGRIVSGRKMAVFGMFCQESREGLIWKVNSKSRRILWSHIVRYLVPGSIIVADKSQNYLDDSLSDDYSIIRKKRNKDTSSNSQNHEIPENNIKIRNRDRRKRVKSSNPCKNSKKHMCEYLYRRRILSHYKEDWERLERFINDIKAAFPGPNQKGLKLRSIGVDSSSQETDEPYFDFSLVASEDKDEEDDTDDAQVPIQTDMQIDMNKEILDEAGPSCTDETDYITDNSTDYLTDS